MKPLSRPSPEFIKPKDNPADYTAGSAPDRVLLINFRIIKYGTNDKIQGAAIFFSLLLFILITITVTFGMFHGDNGWIDKTFAWLTSTFILVLGIAIGRAGTS